MAAVTQPGSGGAAAPPGSPRSPSRSFPSLIVRLVALALIDAAAIWLIYMMVGDGIYWFPLALGLVTVFINIIFLREELFPLRWVSPGMALMALFVVYPILFTVYISFTNYGDGHLLTKQQAIDTYEGLPPVLPEDAVLYSYTAYQDAAGNIMLWLRTDDGSQNFTVRPGEAPVDRTGEPPETLEGYTRLSVFQAAMVQNLATTVFGVEPALYQVHPNFPGEAGLFEPHYTYDAERDVLVDNQTNTLYKSVKGTFTEATVAADGTITPVEAGAILRQGGSYEIVGFQNYVRLFTDPALRQPFALVFVWTVIFAALSVFITFAVGMFLAIVFDVPEMPFRKILRSLLLIPYAIPAFVSVPVWVGLLNPQFGVVSQGIQAIFGWVPPWFADPYWAKIGILLIQSWLGIPYMFVIVTGALQTLPRDVYEASAIDGANAWQSFRRITLPLLLITVGPLLVASFAFNFNNFTVIQLYNRGGPPMQGTLSPVGHTDILATYTYRIAFQSGRGADQGYAAAITVIIFLILVVITALQFRYTSMLEERSENV